MGDEMMREMDEMGLDEVFRLLADYTPKPHHTNHSNKYAHSTKAHH